MMIEIKIPSTIKIGGFDYEIIINQQSDQELDNNNHWGEHSSAKRWIRLHSKAKGQELTNTMIHEILHAVDSVFNNRMLTENETELLANGLHQVLEQLGIRFVKGEK